MINLSSVTWNESNNNNFNKRTNKFYIKLASAFNSSILSSSQQQQKIKTKLNVYELNINKYRSYKKYKTGDLGIQKQLIESLNYMHKNYILYVIKFINFELIVGPSSLSRTVLLSDLSMKSYSHA